MYNALVAGFYGPVDTASVVIPNQTVPVYVILCNVASKKNTKPVKPNYHGSLADYKTSVAKPTKTPPPIISSPTVYQTADLVNKTVKGAVADLAIYAASGAAGKLIGGALGKVTGRKVAQEAFETLVPKSMSQGGKVFRTNTPMGPTLASTKIMTPGQTSAAAKGLTKIASNRATEIGTQIGGKVASGTAGVVKGATVAGIVKKNTNKKDTKRK